MSTSATGRIDELLELPRTTTILVHHLSATAGRARRPWIDPFK